MYFINTDAIVESTINNYFQDEFLAVKNGGSTKDKEAFYFRMRSVKFSEVAARCGISSSERIISVIFGDVHAGVDLPSRIELIKYQLGVLRGLDQEARDDFWHDLPVNSTIGDLAVFVAKARGHNFMIETVGGYLDLNWIASVFGDIHHSILQVVYVSSVDDLIRRVGLRTGQLINASPARITETYNKSYFDVFANVVKSSAFEEISVDVNDTRSFNVVGLKKAARGYTINTITLYGKREEPTENEISFVKRLFLGADLPVEFLGISHVTSDVMYSIAEERPFVLAKHVAHNGSLFHPESLLLCSSSLSSHAATQAFANFRISDRY
jgi:hypothetical protein